MKRVSLLICLFFSVIFIFSSILYWLQGGKLFSKIHAPTEATFGGEVIPLDQASVYKRFDRTLRSRLKREDELSLLLIRLEKYRELLHFILEEEGVPLDLLYVAVSESSLLTHTKSHMGAGGIWQFIPSTGRSLGLRVDRIIDERRHPLLATRAAARYFKKLYDMTGSWTLAAAAYNCGPTKLLRAKTHQKTNDYFSLSLPKETEHYLFKVLTFKELLEKPMTYGIARPKDIHASVDYKLVEVILDQTVSVDVFIKQFGVSVSQFREKNPHLLQKYLPSGRIRLFL